MENFDLELKNFIAYLRDEKGIREIEITSALDKYYQEFLNSKSPSESQAIIAHESDKGACSACVMVNDCRYAVLKQICRHYIKNPQANVTRPKA